MQSKHLIVSAVSLQAYSNNNNNNHSYLILCIEMLVCEQKYNGAEEMAEHLILQCPTHDQIREEMSPDLQILSNPRQGQDQGVDSPPDQGCGREIQVQQQKTTIHMSSCASEGWCDIFLQVSLSCLHSTEGDTSVH